MQGQIDEWIHAGKSAQLDAWRDVHMHGCVDRYVHGYMGAWVPGVPQPLHMDAYVGGWIDA